MTLFRPLHACLALVALSSTVHAQTCGDSDTPCEIASGAYHIVTPEGEGPFPVMMFLHGAGGKAASLVRRGGSSAVLAKRGWAYIAPQGLVRPSFNSTSWSFHPLREDQRDEAAFFADVLKDAQAKFNIDPDRAVLAGFSIGGSMVTYTACDHPDQFMAYAPVGGSFWRPQPAECSGPVRLFHTHGWKDGTVPLEGRYLGDRSGVIFHQGDAFYAMDVFRRENDCVQTKPTSYETGEDYWRRTWTKDCAPGTSLEFALFPGGHGVPSGWANMVIDWVEALPPKP